MKVDEKIITLFSLVFSKLFILRTLITSPPVLQEIGGFLFLFLFFLLSLLFLPPKFKRKKEPSMYRCTFTMFTH